jgi:hypothetical protein
MVIQCYLVAPEFLKWHRCWGVCLFCLKGHRNATLVACKPLISNPPYPISSCICPLRPQKHFQILSSHSSTIESEVKNNPGRRSTVRYEQPDFKHRDQLVSPGQVRPGLNCISNGNLRQIRCIN